MARFAGSLMVLSAALLLAGCGSPKPKDLVKQSIKEWENAAEVLEGVSDESALVEAGKKLDAIATKMAELNRAAASLELNPVEKAEIDREHSVESRAALKRYNDVAGRVRTLPGGEAMLMRFLRMATRR